MARNSEKCETSEIYTVGPEFGKKTEKCVK
jgi:hypothetical protein